MKDEGEERPPEDPLFPRPAYLFPYPNRLFRRRERQARARGRPGTEAGCRWRG